jgi:hypothetical protein
MMFLIPFIPEIPVFAGSHKKYTPVTGVILFTITIPVSSMFGRHMEINRFANFPGFMDDNRLPVDKVGVSVADNDISVDSWSDFTGYAKLDTDIASGIGRANA